jgi:hypothetical protein
MIAFYFRNALGNYSAGVVAVNFEVVGLGTDVMITIFGDFLQLSVKKLAFFSKTKVMIKIFA